MNIGPHSSISAGGLITWTWPQRWPALLPRSRNHRPPGNASSTNGNGLPSGISLSGPSSASTASHTIACGALMTDSFWMWTEATSSGGETTLTVAPVVGNGDGFDCDDDDD